MIRFCENVNCGRAFPVLGKHRKGEEPKLCPSCRLPRGRTLSALRDGKTTEEAKRAEGRDELSVAHDPVTARKVKQ